MMEWNSGHSQRPPERNANMTIESNNKCNKIYFSREIRCSCVYADWGITGHCFYCKLKAKYTDQIEETRRADEDYDLDTDSSYEW